MKICIISGQFKPNQCGISDYIKLLSIEFERLGHIVTKATLNDNISLTDIAQKLPSADIYSLQFAPYLFSPGGLIGSSLIELAKQLKVKKLHVNFHEIWIGAYPNASIWERFMGWRQKREILKFFLISKPTVVTSSNAAALDRLNCSNITSQYLYLFGNIAYSKSEFKCYDNFIKVAIFGTLYEKFPYDILLKNLHDISHIKKKKLQIRIIGRQREEKGLSLLKSLAKKSNLLIFESGVLRTDSISHELQICDLGVCTTPLDIIGKSGATAAMLEHGLPVIAFDDGDTPIDKLFVFKEFKNQIFSLNDETSVTQLTNHMHHQKKPFFDGVAYTANEMLNLIN